MFMFDANSATRYGTNVKNYVFRHFLPSPPPLFFLQPLIFFLKVLFLLHTADVLILLFFSCTAVGSVDKMYESMSAVAPVPSEI